MKCAQVEENSSFFRELSRWQAGLSSSFRFVAEQPQRSSGAKANPRAGFCFRVLHGVGYSSCESHNRNADLRISLSVANEMELQNEY